MPQCLAVATKPVKLAQGVWEVQAGLPMEAFWCVNGPDEVTKYNFTPANKGYGKAKTRKKAVGTGTTGTNRPASAVPASAAPASAAPAARY